jgi:hypothetical protein
LELLKVDNTENKMTWAAGWTRYREEVENARKDEGRWKKNDIEGITEILVNAGELAMGRMGGGGQEQQAPRDHIMIGLLSIRAALDAMIDPLTPYCEVMNRIKNQPGAIKELLHGIQLEGAHQNGVARERAK